MTTDKFWSTMAKRAEPYVPGLQLNNPDIIKLNTNENAYPPSPKVIEAIKDAASKDLQLYPSPTADRLKESIANHYSLSNDQVFVGNGSDEVLAFSFMAFFEPGETIKYPNITYSFYPVYAKLFDIPFEEVPLNDDLTIEPESLFQSDGGVIFPNPNAPTSLYMPLASVEAVIQANENKVVIVDEAYVDFAEASAASLVNKYKNLLVIKTTSKSRALAGLRVGYALGDQSLIKALIRMKDSFNSYTIDRLALAGATASFEDKDYFNQTTEKIVATRERATKQLEAIRFDVLPSATNFLFIRHDTENAAELYEKLLEKNILVRYFDVPLVNNYLRVTVGTNEQMDELVHKLKE